jgi:alkylhydroperoxidase/carboxymuconolactone decarboxylase family protein YurZ
MSESLPKIIGKPKTSTVSKAQAERIQLAHIQAEKDIARSVQRWNAITQILTTGFRSACGIGIAYFVYAALAALAGKSTSAKIVMDIVANLGLPNALGCTAGAGGVAYGLRQKRLRKQNTAHLHPRIKELETLLDQNRTTSGLTATGDTHPQDRS